MARGVVAMGTPPGKIAPVRTVPFLLTGEAVTGAEYSVLLLHSSHDDHSGFL